MRRISKDQAWKNIFDRYHLTKRIAADGYIDLSADAIKAVDAKEPRLMTKVDFRENLPQIMQEEGLSILAIENGLYRIAKSDPFIDVSQELSVSVEQIRLQEDIVTIDPFNIQSESAALDIAAISKMHQKVFGEESFLSIRGRLRGNLSFILDGIPYNVDGVQIEVDGGYEGVKSLHLIEAKMGFKNNINIRQLLYPHRYWEMKIGAQKNVKSYLFYLHNDIFRFIPYIYDGFKGYLDHQNEKAFCFVERESRRFSLAEFCSKELQINQNIPFPQADKFEKVHDMLLVIAQAKSIKKEECMLLFDIVPRQIDYYLNVLRWLNIVEEKDGFFMLNNRGERILSMRFKERIAELAKIALSEPIVYNFYHKRAIPTALFERYKMRSESTQRRRLQSIAAWIEYFEKILEEKEHAK